MRWLGQRPPGDHGTTAAAAGFVVLLLLWCSCFCGAAAFILPLLLCCCSFTVAAGATQLLHQFRAPSHSTLNQLSWSNKLARHQLEEPNSVSPSSTQRPHHLGIPSSQFSWTQYLHQLVSALFIKLSSPPAHHPSPVNTRGLFSPPCVPYTQLHILPNTTLPTSPSIYTPETPSKLASQVCTRYLRTPLVPYTSGCSNSQPITSTPHKLYTAQDSAYL